MCWQQCRDVTSIILAGRETLLSAWVRTRLAAVILVQIVVLSCDEVPQVSRFAWRRSLLQAQDRGGGRCTLSFFFSLLALEAHGKPLRNNKQDMDLAS